MIDRFEKFSYNISEISRCWHKLAADELSKYGLRSAHATYLAALYRYQDGISAPELCRICSKDKADVSRMMSIMEKKGLIKKEGQNRSMYRGLLKLTEEGRKVAAGICERAAYITELAGRDLSEEARTVFYSTLDAITKRLRELSEEGVPSK